MADLALARQLFEARDSAELTQEELGQILGISRVQVGRIESGKRGTYAALVRRWFNACGMDLGAFAIGEGPRTAELAELVAELSDDDLDLAMRVMRALPGMSALGRRMLADIAAEHEEQP